MVLLYYNFPILTMGIFARVYSILAANPSPSPSLTPRGEQLSFLAGKEGRGGGSAPELKCTLRPDEP
jgi:hypothetical protein